MSELDDEMDCECNDTPICPYCGYSYDIKNHEDWDLYEEIEDYKVRCSSCRKTFNTDVMILRLYNTYKLEEEDK